MAKIFGLELAGAKNQKTSLAVMECYSRPKEKKTFLVDMLTGLGHVDDISGDQVVLQAVDECMADRNHSEPIWMGVNVPLTFPPCTRCTKRLCPSPAKCSVPAVRWMRTLDREAMFTPYTQRPVELFLKESFEERKLPSIDDALGGARAALTARMVYLKPHLEKRDIRLVEVNPRLAVSALAETFDIPQRILRQTREIEKGVDARRWIMERWIERTSTFIYDRDLEKIVHQLGAFDAWVCAWVAHMAQAGKTQKPPKGFPIASGWIHYPL